MTLDFDLLAPLTAHLSINAYPSMRFTLANVALSDCSDAVVFKVKTAKMSSEAGLQLAMHVHLESWTEAIGDSSSVDVSLDYADSPVVDPSNSGYRCNGVIYSNSPDTGSLGVSCGGLLATFSLTPGSNPRGAPWQLYSDGDRIRISVHPGK